MYERSIEEHKRLVRKRDKELEQIKNDLEHNVLNASSLSNKVFSFSFIDKKNHYYLVYKTRCRNQCSSN